RGILAHERSLAKAILVSRLTAPCGAAGSTEKRRPGCDRDPLVARFAADFLHQALYLGPQPHRLLRRGADLGLSEHRRRVLRAGSHLLCLQALANLLQGRVERGRKRPLDWALFALWKLAEEPGMNGEFLRHGLRSQAVVQSRSCLATAPSPTARRRTA